MDGLTNSVKIVLSNYTYYDKEMLKFSIPQIEYKLGDSSKKGSHVCFLLIVAMVLLL